MIMKYNVFIVFIFSIISLVVCLPTSFTQFNEIGAFTGEISEVGSLEYTANTSPTDDMIVGSNPENFKSDGKTDKDFAQAKVSSIVGGGGNSGSDSGIDSGNGSSSSLSGGLKTSSGSSSYGGAWSSDSSDISYGLNSSSKSFHYTGDNDGGNDFITKANNKTLSTGPYDYKSGHNITSGTSGTFSKLPNFSKTGKLELLPSIFLVSMTLMASFNII